MDGSGLLLLGHAAAHQLDEGILQRRLTFLDTLNLAAGSLDHAHDTTQRGVAGELEAEAVDAVLLGDAGGGHAINASERVEEAGARAQLKVHDRILLNPLLELARRALGYEATAIDDRHPVAELIRLHHVRGGQDDGSIRVLRHPAAHLVANIPGGADVAGDSLLVQEEDP